jgi:hypothetical protein
MISVNACVNLRPNNFDPPCQLPVPFNSTQQVTHSETSAHACSTVQKMGTVPPPCGRSSPPGHPVVYGWCRDERTMDIPQNSCVRSSRSPSLPQVSRSYDLPPPQCLDSLTLDARRTGPLLPRPDHSSPFPGTPAILRQSEITGTPIMLRQFVFDLHPFWSFLDRPGDGLSCDNCSH